MSVYIKKCWKISSYKLEQVIGMMDEMDSIIIESRVEYEIWHIERAIER